ncbi:MAG: hypothetical protein M3158_05450 [Pseudomonadota bacterium]|jgi:hypothetical protein|nr:hypothetical protein [Pseudomonadota bacterium]
MISPNFFEFVALALALTGLVAVVWEIAAKDARLFGEIAADVRKMAQPGARPAAQPFAPAAPSLGEAANSNGLRKAA